MCLHSSGAPVLPGSATTHVLSEGELQRLNVSAGQGCSFSLIYLHAWHLTTPRIHDLPLGTGFSFSACSGEMKTEVFIVKCLYVEHLIIFFSKNFLSDASSWWQRSTWNYFFQKNFFLRHPPDGNGPNFRSQKQIAFPSNLPLGCNKFCEQQECFRSVKASQILLQYPLRTLPRYNAIHSPKLLLYDTTISKDRKDFFVWPRHDALASKHPFLN